VAEVYGERRPRRRWGRRLLITFIVLLIILGLIAVVADRLGASYAERMIGDRVAQQIADQQATSDQPQVTIKGVPFLTQVVKGDYQEIQIEVPDFAGPAGNGKTIRLPLLDVRAKDVSAPLDAVRSGQGKIVAGTLIGNGTVDYATLADLSDQEGVKLAEKGGKLAVTAPVKILNQSVTVNGTAHLEVADKNVVRVRFEEVTAEGLPDVPIVRNALNNYARQLSIDVPVPALPLNLKVEKVQPTPNGLVVTAGAKNVPLNSAG
jgi:hypothetical protein